MQTYLTKMRAGKFMIPVKLEVNESRIYFWFAYNKILKDEIKMMANHRYHGYEKPNPRKVWSAENCLRNWFQIEYLLGKDPYEQYNAPLIELSDIERPLFINQKELIRFGLTRKRCMFAAEMGLGKTLAAIEVMERSDFDDWYWVGPRSALAAARVDFDKWGSTIKPVMMTYEGLRNDIKNNENIWIPKGIIFDESSKIKTPTTQRSQAASILVEEMRKKHKKDCFIILMSGAPAPRNPGDWWHQLEVACPGFIKEGTYPKFRNRLCITAEKQHPGQPDKKFLEVVTWLDNERKCKTCGKIPDEHTDPLVSAHQWEPSTNEVANLYDRMDGLVITQFKKDCTDLPDKFFYRHKLEPSKETLRVLSLIKAGATRTITALINIRELSDGFQYKKILSEEETQRCPRCEGTGKSKEYEVKDDGTRTESKLVICPKCDGAGEVAKEVREIIEVPCPKEDYFRDLLDEYDSVGRFVTYAGFQASVDRVSRAALNRQWDVIRVDGRGWQYFTKDSSFKPLMSSEAMLNRFQDKTAEGKICFVGQPGAAGMGLTLTASPAMFFYSNTFNAEDRIQTMDRIHRPGMDLEKGARIIDAIHLPVDKYILDNLDKKMDLQDLSLGKLKEHM